MEGVGEEEEVGEEAEKVVVTITAKMVQHSTTVKMVQRSITAKMVPRLISIKIHQCSTISLFARIGRRPRSSLMAYGNRKKEDRPVPVENECLHLLKPRPRIGHVQ